MFSEEELIAMKKELRLLTIEEASKVAGCGIMTMIKLMEQEDFPTIKIGKNNQVQFDALKEYYQHRRILRGRND